MLDKELTKYSKSDAYPFHMPGHKRRKLEFDNPYSIDITEITGFDDLHHSDGLLMEAQARGAKLYGADRCFYLVNGSTCGILAAISAAAKKGSRVLVARNSHKSVYHALYLKELTTEYLYPEITDYNIQGQISPEAIEEKLKDNPDTAAVIITSPTYDGVVSDVKKIGEIVHSYDIPLIVDAAHGAHFGLHETMPQNPINLGADAVIVSIHKTLPAFTQTALLFTKGDRISCSEIERFLDIYETSSPSYVLMAGIEKCLRFMAEESSSYFIELKENLDSFYGRLTDEKTGLKKLKLLTRSDFSEKEAFDFDRTKIIISTVASNMTGDELKGILTEQYGIELEMSSENYGLALSTIMDTREGFMRLADALTEIDKSCEANVAEKPELIYKEQEKRFEIHKTDDLSKKEVSLDQAAGRVCGDYIYLYPPGIPVLVPGEVIDTDTITAIKRAAESGTQVYGLTEKEIIFILEG